MAADALAPFVAKSSAAMVLTVQNKQAIVFHEAEFLTTCSMSVWRNDKMMQIYICLVLKINSHNKV